MVNLRDGAMNIDDDGYDPDEYKPERPRCARCGKFISLTEVEIPELVGLDEYDTYDENENLHTHVVEAEYWQAARGYQCKCGYFDAQYNSGPLTKISYEPPMVGDWQPVEGKPGQYEAIWRDTNSQRIESIVEKNTQKIA